MIFLKRVCIIILLSSLLVFIGCTEREEFENNQAKIIPGTLFEGDTKKLQPHLDMITGCVEVKYKGDKESIGAKYEIWENGEMKEANNITSRFIKNNEFDGRISISLKEDIRDENKCEMKTFISDDKGYGGSTIYIESFYKDFGYGPEELHEETVINDDEEISIWGVSAYKGSFASGGLNIEEEVKKSDWGLVLKVYFE